MIKLDDLKTYLDDLLGEAPPGVDIQANGLQVPGRPDIRRIGFGVSASLDLFKMAHGKGCDALIVHHGIPPPPGSHFDDVFLGRLKFLLDREISLKFLLDREISLFGYHFLLDSNSEIGHAALIIKNLGGRVTKQFYDGWGWHGELAEPMHMDDIVKAAAKLFERDVTAYPVGPSPLTKVAVVSGGGAPKGDMIRELMEDGVELYITGEAREDTREVMREARINFIAGGHYCTERIGVKAVMAKVEEKFDIPCEWLELYNEV